MRLFPPAFPASRSGKPHRPWCRAWVRHGLMGALAAVVPAGALCQEVAMAAPAEGWIGIRSDVSISFGPDIRGGSFAILVIDVYDGGPADLGGIIPGDRLVSVNGNSLATFGSWMRWVTNLVPGDSLRLGVVRSGDGQDVTVVAGHRPPSVAPAPGTNRRESALRIAFGDSAADLWSDPAGRMRAIERLMLDNARMSQDAIEWLRAAEEQTRLLEETFVPPAAGGGGPETRRVDVVEAGRPTLLTPLILGSPVVLGGALVRDLSADLGRYFGVRSGVWVTNVVAMSPAELAGLRPGDVIVSVGDNETTTVIQLRYDLVDVVLPVDLTIVRHRNYLTLSYPASG